MKWLNEDIIWPICTEHEDDRHESDGEDGKCKKNELRVLGRETEW